MNSEDQGSLDTAPGARRKWTRRGFAAMDPARVREISRRGGIAAHCAGSANEFTSERARMEGRKGLAAQAARAREIHRADSPPSTETPPLAYIPAIFDGPIMPVRDVRRHYAAWALKELGGNRTRTAERLGVDVKTLSKWLREHSESINREVEAKRPLAARRG